MAEVNRDRFAYVLAASNFVGYLLALVAPIIIDPRLTTHARYGARQYPHAWIAIPIALGIFLATVIYWRVFRSSLARLLGAAPLLLGTAISLPLFTPEFPHMGVSGPALIWALITTLWMWTRDLDSDIAQCDRSGGKEPMSIEVVRSRLSFCRILLLAFLLGGGFMLVTVLFVNSRFNETFVSDRSELFTVNMFSGCATACCAALFTLGPFITLITKIKAMEALLGKGTLDSSLLDRLAILERQIAGVSEHIALAVSSAEVDPLNSLGKCRTVCHEIVLAIYRAEMHKDPSKHESFDTILNDSQFRSHIPDGVLQVMNSVRTAGNLGAHRVHKAGEITPFNAKRTIDDTLYIIEWYLSKYPGVRRAA
jgi:hypothetical protein